GAQDAATPGFVQLTPALQPVIQITPAVQGTGQQDGTTFSGQPALGKEGGLQSGNAQLGIAADIAKLASKGRLTQRVPQAPRQMVALTPQVVSAITQLQAIDTAPAPALGIGLVPRLQLPRPEGIEAGQPVLLEQCAILRRDEVVHSRPSKN